MKCPPRFVSMKVADEGHTRFRIWFPVFILWPLFAVLLLLPLLATLLADLFTVASGHRPGYTRLLFGCLGVVSETRGTEVFIQDRTHKSRIVALTVR
jgi:hypothetical protein